MKASEIRTAFLKYFESKGHTIVPSSPVVPGDDPTLLFTNAGMNQFKDVFLGFDKRTYSRATTAQKCIRAGGKHNDLENVGYTARHHTFFEMLGNFSFGDYFKQDAIRYAWELLTEVFKLPKDRLYVTVYAEDDEAYDIWTKDIGLPADRVIRIGDNKGARYASDNFWMMGDTGPCGPCTEIFYDHGDHIPGGLPGTPEEDGDRYIEIWNNVFMQFNRDDAGVMHKLPKPSVDTGMGLERITAVLQHVHGNYEIDLFVALLAAAKKAVDEAGAKDCDAASPSLKVIADHIRACSFAVADGLIPGNEWRGYVLRSIARRGIRHGYKLGARRPFFHTLVDALGKQMGDAYPELRQQHARIADVLKQEEKQFFQTIENGMHRLEQALSPVRRALFRRQAELSASDYVWTQIAKVQELSSVITTDGGRRGVLISTYSSDSAPETVPDRLRVTVPTARTSARATEAVTAEIILLVESREQVAEASKFLDRVLQLRRSDEVSWTGMVWVASDATVMSGDEAFVLHDTFGFPFDLTADVCRERGFTVDKGGFDAAMTFQRDQGRAAGKFKMAAGLDYTGTVTTFHGYEHLLRDSATVTAVYVDGAAVPSAKAGDDAVIVLDHTPFYAESGGQVGDSGELRNGTSLVKIDDTQKIQADVFGHHGHVKEGSIQVGDVLNAKVDGEHRARVMRNHSVTHLMHKALREVLGGHVQQKGSLVNAERTRFDFAHNAPMTDLQIREVEAKVNAEILANAATQARVLPMDEAQKSGAMMLFGEKYGDEVRVLDIGTSRELCGGTHVQRTGDIGLFKIVAESGVAAGIRRVEAVTGDNALAYLQQLETTVDGLAATLKAAPAEVPGRVAAVIEQVRALEKELAAIKGKLASSQGDELLLKAVDVKGMRVLAAMLEGADAKALRETMDKLKDKLKSAAIVLAAVDGDKVQLAAGVTADRMGTIKAGELVNFVAQQVGGKGGGKPDLAMAGGNDASKLPAALASVAGWVGERA